MIVTLNKQPYSIDPRDQYLLTKLGKFSASRIADLFVGGKAKKGEETPLFGKTAMSYIRKVAKDAFTGKINQDEDVETKAMMIGKMKEPEAFRAYCSLMPQDKYLLVHHGETDPKFTPHPLFKEDAGCSSDCVAINTSTVEAAWVTDFKCPKSNTHFDYLLDIKDANDLKDNCFEYWAQGQMNMICHNVNIFHWVSYHEDFEPRTRLHIIELERDAAFEQELTERLAKAIQIKYEILDSLKQKP